MKDLLFKLKAGVARSTLDKKELKQVFELVKAGLLTDRETLKFDESVVFGYYLQPKIIKKGKSAAGYLQPMGVRGKDLLVQFGDNKGAQNHDLVIARLIGNRRSRPAAKVLFVVEESGMVRIGFVALTSRRADIYDIASGLPMPHNTKQKALKELPVGTVVTIDSSGVVADILGVLDDPKVDEAIVLTKYNRVDHFDSDLILEAKSFGSAVDRSLYPNRVDLTKLPFITIDPVDAKDFDDAIYYDFEHKTLFVAIADVTSYVAEFTAIDKEARKRGFSVYLPHKSIPMLPRELSENLCSLQPNVDRLAFTFKIELNDDLSVKHYELFESVINSAHRYHYDRIDEIFDRAPKKALEPIDTEILNWLNPLKELIVNLRTKRLKKGFSFESPEIKLLLDKNLTLVDAKKSIETISHQLIEECMLLANCAAAEYFTHGIFRTHEAPDDRSLGDLMTNLSDLGITVKADEKSLHKTIENIQVEAHKLGVAEQVDRMLIRALKRAQYTYDNVGHFGLGFDKYTHFTSPIRRYSDLMLHRLLKSILTKNDKLKTHITAQLQHQAPEISMKEVETAQIEWQYADRVFARWAKAHIGQTLKAEIIEELSRGKEITAIVAETPVEGMRVFVSASRKEADLLNRFDKVRVTITDSNIATARISAVFDERL
ncbi:ribonuclease R [Campylobacterota bacterium]|nr:ribonuclease R [Campylobacterota bacterium]